MAFKFKTMQNFVRNAVLPFIVSLKKYVADELEWTQIHLNETIDKSINDALDDRIDEIQGVILPPLAGNEGKYLTTDGTKVQWMLVPVLPDSEGKDGYVLSVKGGYPLWVTKEEIGIGSIPCGTAVINKDGNFNVTTGTGNSGQLGIDGNGDYVLGLETKVITVTIDNNNDFVLGK